MTGRYIIDRKLPDRSKLIFYFPNTGEGIDFYRVEVPFFENPQIKESKKARYQKHSLISRSSDLNTYLGADSRQFKLEFNITLPHLLHQHSNLRFSEITESPEVAKLKFKTPIGDKFYHFGSGQLSRFFFRELKGLKESAKQVLSSEWAIRGITPEEKNYLRLLYGLDESNVYSDDNRFRAVDGNSSDSFFLTDILNFFGLGKKDQSAREAFETKYKIIDVIVYWVNIIRSSVVNNSKNPVAGPPIIRLRHGIMYQNVPCICTDFAIENDETAGYDLETLLPNRIRISMSLEEYRAGDFGSFNQRDLIQRDNLAGWEAVIDDSTRSMDPGYATLL